MSESAVSVAALERLPFFAGLERDDLEEIVRAGHPVSFTAGETLVERGDPGDAMYIVLSGAAEVDVGGGSTGWRRGTSWGRWPCSPARSAWRR